MNRNSIGVILLVAVLSACGGSDQAGIPQETALSGTVEILCDEEIITLLQSAKVPYDSIHKDANVTLKAVTAEQATFDLLRHQTKGIIIGRDWLPQEAEDVKASKGAEGYPRSLLAKDALVFFASKSFPYDTMHSAHLSSWLAGGEFPLASYPKLSKPPTVVVPGSQSSVYGNMINVVLKGKQPGENRVRSLGRTDSVRMGVLSNNGYLGVGYLSQLIKDTAVKMLRLSWTDSTGAYQYPRLIHAGNLVQGLYPFPVPIYFVLRDKANQHNLASGFMMFLARDGKAQRAFFDAGIEPGYANIVIHTEE